MRTFKKLIAGALITASLAAPMPVHAAEESAPLQAPVAAGEPLPGSPAAYFAEAQKATAAVPSADLDMTCRIITPIGQATAQIVGSYVLSVPVEPTDAGFRPKLIRPTAEIPDDTIFVMKGALSTSLQSVTKQNSVPESVPFYVKADKTRADVYTYDNTKKIWEHMSQNIPASEKSTEKATMEKDMKILSGITMTPRVKDAPSTADTRSFTVELNLQSVFDAVRRLTPKNGNALPELNPEAYTLLLEVDVDRKTHYITREASDISAFVRAAAHAMLDSAKKLDETNRQSIASLIDASTVQFEARFSNFGKEKDIVIPADVLNTPVTPMPKPKKEETHTPSAEPAKASNDVTET